MSKRLGIAYTHQGWGTMRRGTCMILVLAIVIAVTMQTCMNDCTIKSASTSNVFDLLRRATPLRKHTGIAYTNQGWGTDAQERVHGLSVGHRVAVIMHKCMDD